MYYSGIMDIQFCYCYGDFGNITNKENDHRILAIVEHEQCDQTEQCISCNSSKFKKNSKL